MIYKITKKIFSLFYNLLSGVQVFLVFLAFFTLLYWILSLAKVEFVSLFAPFFEAINTITTVYYKRTIVIDEVSISFSYLITAIVILVVAGALSYLKNLLKNLESNFDETFMDMKRFYAKLFNKHLETSVLKSERKIKKFMFLVSFKLLENANNILKKTTEFDGEAKTKEVLNLFAKELVKKVPLKYSVNDGAVLFYGDDFDKIDEVVATGFEASNLIETLCAKEKIKANSAMALEVFQSDKEIQYVFKVLKRLLELKLYGEVVCMSPFKMRYSLQKQTKYRVDTVGLFKIINDQDEVFLLFDKSKQKIF